MVGVPIPSLATTKSLELHFSYVLKCIYVWMKFERDPSKNESNQKKQGIDFDTAQLVFDDPRCISFIERFDRGRAVARESV